MKTTKTLENGILTVELEGKLDTSVAPEVEKEINESLDDAD